MLNLLTNNLNVNFFFHTERVFQNMSKIWKCNGIDDCGDMSEISYEEYVKGDQKTDNKQIIDNEPIQMYPWKLTDNKPDQETFKSAESSPPVSPVSSISSALC